MKKASLLFAIAIISSIGCMAQALPDAPSVTVTGCSPCNTTTPVYVVTFEVTPTPPTVHFYTFRKSWEDPPLRTNKQVFRSKVFIASHAAGWGAMIFACKRHRSGEDFGSEAPAMAVVTGMDYLMFRLVSGVIPLGSQLYATGHYLKAGL